MKAKEIARALIGKTIFYWNSWNGECDSFVIGHIEIGHTASVRLRYGRDRGWGVFVPKSLLPTLISTGRCEYNFCIEGCNCIEEWKLI